MGTVLWLAHRRRNQDETCSVRSHLLSASRVKFSASKKTKPEQREHEVLHRQQRDRLSSLGSGSWGGNSVFCQPGVEPLQRRQPRWHQRRKPGNKHKVSSSKTSKDRHSQVPCLKVLPSNIIMLLLNIFTPGILILIHLD